MSGIAGIAESGMSIEVNQMLDKIDHRGPDGRKVMEFDGATLGAVWTEAQEDQMTDLERQKTVMDRVAGGHIAYARVRNDRLEFIRDQLGIAPLYYGHDENGTVCFASEVKGLLETTNEVRIVPPGNRYDGTCMKSYYRLKRNGPLEKNAGQIAKELQQRLDDAITRFVEEFDVVGSWLSGGLDSSTLTALACPHVRKMHTFAAGFPDAPDLKNARKVAISIESDHHEVILNFDDVLSVLPDVIYHLESFDALLVRSSIINYLVAQMAAEYVPAVISGEGGDELFAGYDYMKSLNPNKLPRELIAITNQLHNTALQRVDRSASAHGTMAHVAFLDPNVVNYAFRIPAKFKLFNGVEKWILRKAIERLHVLPKHILARKKSKFWKGTGLTNQLQQYAEKQIGDDEFHNNRTLPNGWILNTKEELMYYRIFHKHFRKLKNFSWMGRTKGAPRQSSTG